MRWLVVSLLATMLAVGTAQAQTPLTIKIGVIRQIHSRQTISLLDIPAKDDVIAGAMLGIADSNSTGKFTGQNFELTDIKLNPDEGIAAAVQTLDSAHIVLVIADLPAALLLELAHTAPQLLIFNASAGDESLREEDCRANIIHIAPSHSMRADAVVQYLVWRQWKKALLIKGSHPQDELLAKAYRDGAKKFGLSMVEERTFTDTGGSRRTDSGSVQAQRQMPVLTQSAPAYDVVIAADESQVFAGYLPYRTWDARPVVGSAGLVPTSWDPTHEQWGAAQLQNRFNAMFKHPMNERDNNAWLGARMIGEAATRLASSDPVALRALMISPEFSVAAFRGEKLSVRSWNQQVRQPVLLGDGRTIVSVSPQEGFLHQTTQLDTLGIDQPATKCSLRP